MWQIRDQRIGVGAKWLHITHDPLLSAHSSFRFCLFAFSFSYFELLPTPIDPSLPIGPSPRAHTQNIEGGGGRESENPSGEGEMSERRHVVLGSWGAMNEWRAGGWVGIPPPPLFSDFCGE